MLEIKKNEKNNGVFRLKKQQLILQKPRRFPL